MAKDNTGTVGILIGTFIIALLGIIFVSIVADQTQSITSTGTAANETIDTTTIFNATGGITSATTVAIANAPGSWQATDCPITGFAVRNSTGYTITEAGNFTFVTTTGNLNFSTNAAPYINTTTAVYVDYVYCPDDYINSSWGRTVQNLVPGFFALAILLAAAFIIYFILKREGYEI